jgi:UDP-N-acetylmuramate dehydrogenase
MKNIISAFPQLYETARLRLDEALSAHCTFRIGGPADYFAIPETQQELISLLSYALSHRIPYFILGKGSNLLVSDKGIRGLVISTEAFGKITRDEQYISAFCGVQLKDLCAFAMREGLAGLEFASGIPGSVGGAVFMNAGAYNGEIKDVLYCSKCLNPTLDSLLSSQPVLHLKAEAHHFGYRRSALQALDYVHLSSVFKLIPEDPDVIKARMEELDLQRWSKQPMDLPSAGSVFKRPEGHFTGKLVDDCGLRGFRIGDAAVSNLHCGFIVNLGKATAQDVLNVIQYVQETVFARFGVKLETEIRMVGER